MKKSLLILIKWLPALSIFGISFYLSSLSTIQQIPAFPYADKLVHFICFGGLAFWVAFGCDFFANSKLKIFVPVIIVSIYGIIDEIHQSFTPGRSSTVGDWIADTLGALLGSFIFYLISKLIQKWKNTKNNKEK